VVPTQYTTRTELKKLSTKFFLYFYFFGGGCFFLVVYRFFSSFQIDQGTEAQNGHPIKSMKYAANLTVDVGIIF
jgi:hypothetical protein